MNIDNISRLGLQLSTIGFDRMEVSLLKRICFRPSTFELQQSIQKDTNAVLFNFHFKQEQETGDYSLQYYDVTLQKDLSLSSTVIGSIDITALETNMAAIDWKNIFSGKQTNWTADTKACWETATFIDNICEQLTTISFQEEGLQIASKLKLRYWSHNLPDDLIGCIATVKTKSDISQRFYFSEDNSITIDEAYRFLQNKWIEKQLQQRDRISKLSDVKPQQTVQKKKEKSNPKN